MPIMITAKASRRDFPHFHMRTGQRPPVIAPRATKREQE
jgi:hypothetical protein